MEPWLDSLSEDWGSEHRSSSPAPTATRRRRSSSLTSSTQSRIPHLAHSLRRDSSVSYIKPRSAKGIARSKTAPVLTERTPSSLNIPASQILPQKFGDSQTFPRQPSSAYSESQQSVQHYSIRRESIEDDETPEWKKRLTGTDDVASDGFDLFSPSKLEGIFKQPGAPTTTIAKEQPKQVNPWNSLSLQPLSISEQYQSLRASRSRPGPLEVLEEVNEDEEGGHDFSVLSAGVSRQGSMKGLVRHRVSEIEDKNIGSEQSIRSPGGDPRFRTISGREELKNEIISPVTLSKQNSIRGKAIQGSQKVDTATLRHRLSLIQSADDDRPSSSSSDRAVSYGHQTSQAQTQPRGTDAGFADITSQSLPEDVSMGTQEFVSHGGYVNGHRGEYSDESSFLRKGLSGLESFQNTATEDHLFLRSSPPPCSRVVIERVEASRLTASLPGSPNDSRLERHWVHENGPISSTKPLYLSGDRDNFNDNRLVRGLSHFEEKDVVDERTDRIRNPDAALFRMSQFGEGDLDGFDFQQEVERPQAELIYQPPTKGSIFQRLEAAQDTVLLRKDDKPFSNDASEQAQVGLVSGVDRASGSNYISHSKAPEPKRRRTLVDGQITVEETDRVANVELEDNVNQLAGTKRKDARPGTNDGQADPDTLASRTLLRPKVGRRTSSTTDSTNAINSQIPVPANATVLPQETASLTKALAAELASFTQTQDVVQHDSRKPSYATKDYMEEANKVMQLIRARGKPQPTLTAVEEPEFSELNPDSIIDLEVDGDSTKESFSRPPSRERPSKPWPNPRHMKHDSKTENHLRQFKDSEDLDLLASTSVLGPVQLVDDNDADEAALIPVPDDEQDDEQESSPPNLRIRNHDQTQRKRKHSASTVEGQLSLNTGLMQTHEPSSDSTRRDVHTSSSTGSGQKGVIASGTISIPDHVGTMVFDHKKNIWVSRNGSKVAGEPMSERRTATDEDPFQNIPDLSFDEQKESERTGSHRNTLNDEERGQYTQADVEGASKTKSDQSPATELRRKNASSENKPRKDSTSHATDTGKSAETDEGAPTVSKDASIRSQASKHESRLYDGLPSRPPAQDERKQPRVVTIAFSSPLVSAYHKEPTVSEIELEGEDDLPLDDSEFAISPVCAQKQLPNRSEGVKSSKSFTESYADVSRAMVFSKRPVSRIDERDEDEPDYDMSMVHVKHSKAMTPAAKGGNTIVSRALGQPGSMLCLTPLSDFTIHQQDSAKHHEQSFVEERPHPKALRPAHGALALAVDALVKAITDAEPTEPFWENIRRLSLTNKGLTTTHGLQDYCSSLEELCISGNSLAQLGGLPSSLRVLSVHANLLTKMTSWGHLQNLQYVDVSKNQLESLEGFSSLVHLRKIDAGNNNISNIDGILDLDGLLEVNLRHNKLTEVDFEGTDLPRLAKLNLSHNQLTSVRNSHCLAQLVELDVSHNDLQNILDTDKPGLNFLRKVTASHNQLEFFDLPPFPALEEVVLDNNCVRAVSGLSTAYNLRKISLKTQVGQSDVIYKVLSTLNECQEIDVSWNKILPEDLVLPGLPQHNLRKLELAGCGLSTLPPGFGDSFPNCRSLNLNFNAIRDLQPLQGMLKLKDLNLAGNRIRRLRRTCLVLSRLTGLTAVDLSDNPLTIGFHAPNESGFDLQAAERLDTHLAARSAAQDDKWLILLDEVTTLRRRTAELLLAQGCAGLVALNRLPFVRDDVRKVDLVWQNLADKGVLQKSPRKGLVDGRGMIELSATAENTVDMEATMNERSLIWE